MRSALSKVPGVWKAEVDLDRDAAFVDYDGALDEPTLVRDLCAAAARAGYQPCWKVEPRR